MARLLPGGGWQQPAGLHKCCADVRRPFALGWSRGGGRGSDPPSTTPACATRCNRVRNMRPRRAAADHWRRKPTSENRGLLQSTSLLDSLREWRSQDRRGSNPLFRTKKTKHINDLDGVAIPVPGARAPRPRPAGAHGISAESNPLLRGPHRPRNKRISAPLTPVRRSPASVGDSSCATLVHPRPRQRHSSSRRIGIAPIADMDADQTIVTARLAAKSRAETPEKVR